jgi:hypothetical protein
MLSRFTQTKWRWGVLGLALALAAAVFGVMALTRSDLVSAHQNPPDCTVVAIATSLSGDPAAFVQHGNTINYTVTFSNTSPTGVTCDVTDFDATLFRPNGSSIAILTDLSLPSGTSITCPGGVGCAPGPYSYVVAHVDETGPITGCPPVPQIVGARQVTAYVQGLGVAHSVVHEAASACATKGNPVIHVPTVETEVHAPPHVDITNGTVLAGVPVHDFASVTGEVGTPEGTVDFALFQSGTCSGSPIQTWNNVALVGGQAESPAFTPLAAGPYSYQVHYDGQAGVYAEAVGPCEPFTVVEEPDISIVKTAGTAPDGTVLEIQPGDAVTFHYLVCNTGDVPLHDVSVTDDSGTPGDPTDDFTVAVPDLAVGQCVTVNSAPITIPNPPICDNTRLNIGEAGGTSPGGTVVRDRDDAELCTPEVPDISIVKTAGAAPDGTVLQIQPGDAVVFHYLVCNEGNVALHDVSVTDNNATPADPSDDFTMTIGNLAVGQCVTVDSAPITIPNPPVCDQTRLNVGEAVGTSPGGTVVRDRDDAELCTPPAGEGCTPGFWKQPQHFDAWTSPYDPDDLFSAHFENAFPGMTLLQVLSQGGGGLNALGRHTVAALLNAASPDVDFAFSPQEVIGAFNAVFPGGDYEALKNRFAAENERGCPLN